MTGRSRRAGLVFAAGAALLLAIGFTAVALPVERALPVFDARAERLLQRFAGRTPDAGSPDSVRTELRSMVAVDQLARDVAGAVERRRGRLARAYFQLRFRPRALAIERSHVERLEALLARHGWIRRDRFGAEADRHAWLLAHHADVHPEFQRRVLALLDAERRTGGTHPQHYARLFDRLEVHAARPQRYGTQGHCTGPSRWEPRPIAEPEALDARRRELGLDPFETLRQGRAAKCRSAELF